MLQRLPSSFCRVHLVQRTSPPLTVCHFPSARCLAYGLFSFFSSFLMADGSAYYSAKDAREGLKIASLAPEGLFPTMLPGEPSHTTSAKLPISELERTDSIARQCISEESVTWDASFDVSMNDASNTAKRGDMPQALKSSLSQHQCTILVSPQEPEALFFLWIINRVTAIERIPP